MCQFCRHEVDNKKIWKKNASGIAISTIGQIIHGKRKAGIKMKKKICRYLDVPVNSIFPDDPDALKNRLWP